MPQGSVLGPLLFLIYINDLVNNVQSSIRLFADDCVIYRVIYSDTDPSFLQTDLNSITNWCDVWKMRLNASKCKVMRISRKAACTNPPQYNIGSVLEQVTSYKYLGVHITSDLSWQTHINFIANNANRMLGYLRRNFSRAPSSLKLLLYKTLVRSKLEYASSVWDPGHEFLINQIESVQNRGARFILSNFSRFSSVSSMKLTLHLPNLSLRRKLSRLSLFHKIYHHNQHLSEELFSEPSYVSHRNDHHHKVNVPFSRTKLFFDSFIPRTTNDWNHLPTSIATITDAPAFKSAIENYYVN